jgi:DNA-binding CsgD family transcriptional regulator/tetratricopeptide (TPR) repeat protein
VLLGRETECARLDELLDRARTGRSGALVLRGEAGIGKTALLDYSVARAEGMTVVRTLGIESEAELEFSALLDVCRPLLGCLEGLPGPQADALRSGLGFAPAGTFDRHSVGVGTLGLLAAAAETTPLLVVVDDAQWLDRASADALRFATRRLHADRVAVLFAARDDEELSFDAPGIESLPLEGLDRAQAGALLRERAGVGEAVVNRLYEATSGNPLALVELPALLSPAQLSGEEPLDDPLPAGASVERAFARRAQELPDEAGTALLVAAASTSSASEMLVRALEQLGLSARSLEPAEDAGLVRIVDGRFEFRHPLVRSAVYHAARPSDRRAAHRALADACRDTGPEEWAWHLAVAALGPDENAAAALEQAAGTARQRSGYAAAATALERSARLTPERDDRLRRLAAAADAAWQAGRTESAVALVRQTLAGAEDPALRANALRLYGEIEILAGKRDAAARAFLEATDLLERIDPTGAVAAAADAVYALPAEHAMETARRARSLAPEDGSEADGEAAATLGYVLSFEGRYTEARPHLDRAVELLRHRTSIPTPLQAARLSAALAWLGRYEDGHRFLATLVARARAAGAVGALPYLLAGSSWQALHADRWNEAEADAAEAHQLAEELGQPPTQESALGVLTWVHALRGDEGRCRVHGEQTRRLARALAYTIDDHLVSFCFGVLDLAAGRVDDAIAELEPVARYTEERNLRIPRVPLQLEFAEALIRAGRGVEAEAVLDSFERSERVTDRFLAAAALRCRGLLADEDGFDARFEEALDLHSGVASPFALARTQLCYGERLRRAGRRRDAREQLRSALATLEALGAAAWAERARSELRASGETLRRRAAFEEEQLTPQELQIALQVAEGKTNKEVGAALFLSHKTVEFHLSRIYRKLDLNSRAELIRRFAAEGVPA